MAEIVTAPQAQEAAGAQSPAKGKSQRAPSAPQAQPKRNHRHRKSQSQQLDGTVSDSVTNPMATPRSKKGQAQKQRQQSMAIGALPNQNTMPKMNGQKPRPVSLGGNMLPVTPLKEQAYAGPTFQASPAPSSLPVPKFFSKSVPNVAQQSLETRLAGERTPEKEGSSPEPDIVVPESPGRAAQQSPLDFFFKAHRAENDKDRNSSSLPSEIVARQPPPNTEPRNPFQQSGRSVFLRELDGHSDAMPSPKTMPPDDRPSPLAPPPIQAPNPANRSESDAYTKSLKDLLFSNANGAPPQDTTPPPSQQRMHSNPRAYDSTLETPPSFQRSRSGPSTPAPLSDQPNQHYSLHYGNRNLSPLFKAARGDTPTRPSNLRQQSFQDDLPSPTHGNIRNTAPQPRQIPQIDPGSFSRNYLDRHIQSSQPATMPHIPLTNVSPSSASPGPQAGPNTSRASQRGVKAPSLQAHAPPRTGSHGGANGASTLEDDLRRMLKVNVLGS